MEQAPAFNGMREVQFRSAPISSQETAVPVNALSGTAN